MGEPSKPRFIVAIDFGTSTTGYAYAAIKGDGLEILELNFFEREGARNRDKVCTCLLLHHYQGKFEFRKFGNEADESLSDVTPEVDDLCAFKYFKMNLFDENTTVEAQNGVKVPIVDIIQYTIKYVVHEALNRMKEAGTEDVTHNEIQWVITVPAIWSDAAKHVMRVAAQRAGLPQNLILALEPEAAALCCRKDRKLKFEAGTKYMVVDCGGGTVDIAVHEIDNAGYTHSMAAPDGGAWGSTMIDKNFSKLLDEILDEGEVNENPDTMFTIMQAFEQAKKNFPQRGNIKIPLGQLSATIPEKHKKLVSVVKGNLIVSPDAMYSFYTPVIDEIVACVDKLIKNLNCTMRYIFLVGGFSDSLVLKDRMIEVFQSEQTKIVIPTNPQTAVLEGGLHFGLNPSVIASRYLSYTYGVRSTRDFVPGDPEEFKYVTTDKVVKCDKVFSKFVSIHQKVENGQKIVDHFGRTSSTQKRGRVVLYGSKEANPKYITKEMKKIGKLWIDVPVDEPLNAFNIEVSFIFGGTELEVRVRHKVTNKEVSNHWEFKTDDLSASLILPLRPT